LLGKRVSPKVALINMPFASARRPSLALGLLKAIAQKAGAEVRVFNFNLAFAEGVGLAGYEMLCGANDIEDYRVSMEQLTGEWLFSQYFHGSDALDAAGYAEYLKTRGPIPAEAQAAIDAAHDAVPAFIQSCVAAADWSQFDLIGFSSTFEQTMACLSLAREIKTLHRRVKIVLGGANCESTMGAALARNYEFVDLVCTGEGDLALPELLRAIRDGSEWWNVAGFCARHDGKLHLNAPPPVTRDLDALPYPDFDEYFEELPARGLTEINPGNGVLLETSRGCWWGAKSHCTFCGLNGRTMQFRVKKPERAFAELEHFIARHGSRNVEFADNIVDMAYFDSFLARIAGMAEPPEIFYETKSNLRRRHLRRLSEANVFTIQPGIESFDDDVLARMGKGVRGVHNIAVLKWSRGYGVRAMWNLLFGFPGESAASYAWIADLFRRLTHLDPPTAASAIRLDRFSPNFVRAAEKGITGVRPTGGYRHVFDVPEKELSELAYFFDFDYADGRQPLDYCKDVVLAAYEWGDRFKKESPVLHATLRASGIEIWDTRAGDPRAHRMKSREARLYCHFDEPHRDDSAIPLALALGFSDAQLLDLLKRWDDAGLVVRRNGMSVGLATMEDELLARFAPQALQANCGTRESKRKQSKALA
jgi:ribosomal peptide maturation radical SAM protein 1